MMIQLRSVPLENFKGERLELCPICLGGGNEVILEEADGFNIGKRHIHVNNIPKRLGNSKRIIKNETCANCGGSGMAKVQHV